MNCQTTSFLFVPGWHGSCPEHWQTLWQVELPHACRIEQRDWENPLEPEWIAAIRSYVLEAQGRPVLVAHSLGCVAVVRFALADPEVARRVAGALLVAPPDLGCAECKEQLRGFAPVPREPLPFPSLVVASENDPYITLESAAEWARSWGSRFENEGRAGHINTASGHGKWPEGWRHLQTLLKEIEIPMVQNVQPVR